MSVVEAEPQLSGSLGPGHAATCGLPGAQAPRTAHGPGPTRWLLKVQVLVRLLAIRPVALSLGRTADAQRGRDPLSWCHQERDRTL